MSVPALGQKCKQARPTTLVCDASLPLSMPKVDLLTTKREKTDRSLSTTTYMSLLPMIEYTSSH